MYPTHTHSVQLQRKGVTWLTRRYNYEQFKSYVNQVPRAWFLGRMYVALVGACDLLSPLLINT
jgi:hypothetical protein